MFLTSRVQKEENVRGKADGLFGVPTSEGLPAVNQTSVLSSPLCALPRGPGGVCMVKA